MDQLVGIHTHASMGSKGRFVLRAMQDNNEMPLIDLFVREVLQNSLDAGKGRSQNSFDDCISVDFIIGSFDSKSLNAELSGSTDLLNNDALIKNNKFLAVRDCNTVGLNGKVKTSEYSENESFGNFIKLVYEIGEPQENVGSGGSWGLGKTVYFRIGIGLVLYYSQFEDEEGNLQCRFAGTIVEDNNNIKYQPRVNGGIRTGISWWGEFDNEGDLVPLTDKDKVNSILEIFNIKPFCSNETGTIVIIPYINEEELLKSNSFEYKTLEGKNCTPYWNLKLKDSLKMAVQRWFFPRLNNDKYQYGQYLSITICNEALSLFQFSELYKILWDMYRLGFSDTNDTLFPYCKYKNIYPKVVSITLNGYFRDGNNELGKLVFAKVCNTTTNGSSIFQIAPNYFLNDDPENSSSNKIIIPFVRKPGMVISYNIKEFCKINEIELSEDEYIIGVFVLNSDNKFIDDTTYSSLDEYIRKGEKAQHTEWIDQPFSNKNGTIVKNIKNKIKNALIDTYSKKTTQTNSELSSNYSYRFSSILPPLNTSLGNKLSQKKKSPIVNRHYNCSVEIDYSNIEYQEDCVIVKGKVVPGRKKENIQIILSVISENGNVMLDKWLGDGLPIPFSIGRIDEIDDEELTQLYINGKMYGFNLKIEGEKEEVFAIKLIVYSKDYMPTFTIKVNEVVINE